MNNQSDNKPGYLFYIGIDCGVNTGVCVCDGKTRKMIHLSTTTILQAIKFVSGFCENNGDTVLVRV